jgi:hypothetical protein
VIWGLWCTVWSLSYFINPFWFTNKTLATESLSYNHSEQFCLMEYNIMQSALESTEVSEEHVASIFRVEEYVKQETLKEKAKCSCVTSVDFQRTTRRYIPENRTFHTHRCENLKPYIITMPVVENATRQFTDRYGYYAYVYVFRLKTFKIKNNYYFKCKYLRVCITWIAVKLAFFVWIGVY